MNHNPSSAQTFTTIKNENEIHRKQGRGGRGEAGPGREG